MRKVSDELRTEAAKAWHDYGVVVCTRIWHRPDWFIDPERLEAVIATDDPERVRKFITDVNESRRSLEAAVLF